MTRRILRWERVETRHYDSDPETKRTSRGNPRRWSTAISLWDLPTPSFASGRHTNDTGIRTATWESAGVRGRHTVGHEGLGRSRTGSLHGRGRTTVREACSRLEWEGKLGVRGPHVRRTMESRRERRKDQKPLVVCQ